MQQFLLRYKHLTPLPVLNQPARNRGRCSVAIALLLAVPGLHAELLVKPNDVVALCGDSNMMPGMASMEVGKYLLMCQPVSGVHVIQAGTGGERLVDFMNRIAADLPPYQPTVVLASHGVDEGRNDPLTQTFAEDHLRDQTKAIETLKKIGVKTIVLGSPGCADPYYLNGNPAAAIWNKNLAGFRDLDRQVASKEGIEFADVYASMIDALPKAKAAYGEKYVFAGTDGLHPDGNGQLIVAYSFLKALGCDGAIGTITVDLATDKAEGTPGHKILSAKNGVVEIESTRYPFCFRGDPDQPGATTGIVQCFPFNEDLNRYLLFVKGLTAPKARITWGDQSREFSASDLEKGVNLAAAFAAHTPFDSQFAKVEGAVEGQQGPEFIFTQFFFHNIEDFKTMAPGKIGAINKLTTAMVEQDRHRGDAAAALVIPVRHTIKVEPISR